MYFKIAFRNLTRHRFYAGINVFGLSLGIGCCIILFQFISYHLSFDTYHTNANQLYKVVNELHLPDGSVEFEKGAPMITASAFASQIPQVKNSAVLLNDRSFTVAVNGDNSSNTKLFAEHENIALADKQWFDLFTYQWLEGSNVSALTEPNTVVLTSNLAHKYFGDADAMGKVITIDNKIQAKVTGVLANNVANTDVKAELFLSLSSFKPLNPDFAEQMQKEWWFVNSHTAVFLQLAPNASAKQVEKAMAVVTNKGLDNKDGVYNFKLMPLKQLHFDARYGGVMQKPLLLTLALVGLLLIIIACVNFINMATAQSTRRAKEIGTRKVLGSTPAGIFRQFITETGLVVTLSVVLSVIWMNFFLPVLNAWLGTQLTLNIFGGYRLPLFLTGLFALITFAAGFYPAVMLSRFKPVNALKNQINANINTGQYTRKGLIIVQNVIAQVLIICTLLISLQTGFLKNADTGLDKNAVVVVPLPDHGAAKTDYLRSVLVSNPAVKSVTYCYRPAISTSDKGGTIKYGTREWSKFPVRSIMGDADFVKTFGLKIIAGKNLLESDTVREYLVNEKLVEKLGIKNINEVIGRQLIAGDLTDKKGIIVGVVKDFHAKSLYTAIEPEVITTSRDNYQYAAVKITGRNLPQTVEHIKNSWKAAYPANAFEYRFLDDQIAEFYGKEELLGKLIKASTTVAILISCLGLLGLISLITTQRIKEIGIRKVLGASVGDITMLLSKDFLKLVLIAIVVAIPAAWLMMYNWLQNFAYHIEIPLWVFAATAVVSVLVALVTTGIQSVKAAIANPVNSLRSE